MIAFITRLLPFLGPLLEKLTGKGSARAEELRAQAELEEIRAFKQGRISPRFLQRYALVFIFSFFAALFLGSLFLPQWVSSPDFTKFRDLLDLGSGIVP